MAANPEVERGLSAEADHVSMRRFIADRPKMEAEHGLSCGNAELPVRSRRRRAEWELPAWRWRRWSFWREIDFSGELGWSCRREGNIAGGLWLSIRQEGDFAGELRWSCRWHGDGAQMMLQVLACLRYGDVDRLDRSASPTPASSGWSWEDGELSCHLLSFNILTYTSPSSQAICWAGFVVFPVVTFFQA
jgi:hypothetical protein